MEGHQDQIVTILKTSERWPSFAHQVEIVHTLVESPAFLNASEMGTGKTKTVIDAAQVLYARGNVDQVIVVAPASVRAVWYDPELGELAKHLWDATPANVVEYHARSRSWHQHCTPTPSRFLAWLVTNYDYIRSADRLDMLLKSWADSKTLLVLDESSAVKNASAKQTKACLKLRRACGRVWLLNGTPIANHPGDLFSQANIMDPAILACRTYFHFRARYAMMGGWKQKQVIGWRDLEDLQNRLKPFTIRRLKTDCLDLPPKLPPVTLEVPLTDATWKIYREMRDELVAWLDQQTVSVAPQAAVKALRLAQITSGFLGGVDDAVPQDDLDAMGDRPAWIDAQDMLGHVGTQIGYVDTRNGYVDQRSGPPAPTRAISSEKHDFFLAWLRERLDEDATLKLLVWCRFRPEVARIVASLRLFTPTLRVGEIVGGQKRDKRDAALRLLDPRTAPRDEPVVVVGTPASGSMGLNLASANVVMYTSNDWSYKTRLQSEDRVHRPGQTKAVSYFDVVATGPKGQKTIDHAVLKALRAKDDLARWTTRAWVQALREVEAAF